ncbi:MAG: NAD(P)-binding protein, partial [Bdellovibrionales bacterium]|nr:NAD(P)-binding protein [Bdellovibrionales bacterium]
AVLDSISPIHRLLGDVAAPKFFADEEPERAHAVLWDKPGFIASHGGTLPPPSEHVPLVIIGGGMSGLTSGYLLRKYQPVILEQAPQFGGNSKGQSWRGIDYSIGAAYLIKPDEGSGIEKLLSEIGISSRWKDKGESETFELNGSLAENFWSSGSTVANAHQFQTLKEYFQNMWNGDGEPFPEIPILEGENGDYVKRLDAISFRSHLESIVGEELDPLIEAALEQYCWSSFGGTLDEISAACGLNFYSAEFGDIVALPGGNSAVAEELLTNILHAGPRKNLRANSLVFDVTVKENGVNISYRDENGEIRTIHSKAAILSIPKFVVGKVLTGIEEERLNAIRKLRYRSYLVANVLLKGEIAKKFYDLYLLGDGKIDRREIAASAKAQGATDVILGNFASSGEMENTVLTLYRGFPYDGVRAELYVPGAYERFRSEFESQIYQQILPLLRLQKSDVIDIRLARWGHPLPLAEKGLISGGVPETLRKPFQNRV